MSTLVDTMATMMDMTLRSACPADGAACAAIYAPYVTDTAITYETEPPSAVEMGRRIEASVRNHAWIVLEDGGRVIGYAYGTPHKTRPAYRWSCEVSVYLEPGRRRTGAGRTLYEELFARLAGRGFRMALAGVSLPNDASLGLHRAMGFEPIGTYRRIGWKHGRWHDCTWLQRELGAGEGPPAELS